MIIIKTDVLPTAHIQEDAIYEIVQNVSQLQSYLAYYKFVGGKWEQVDVVSSESLLQQQRLQLLHEYWSQQTIMQATELTNSIIQQRR
ncbi:MAG: hypothetical protein II453_13690 [Alphaproteobacteria bacterium]|nr:hypothetical protein [Alphaproteobacteria bacterium]